jgi:hypothetical protein
MCNAKRFTSTSSVQRGLAIKKGDAASLRSTIILLREVFSIEAMTYIREGMAGTCTGLSIAGRHGAEYKDDHASPAWWCPRCWHRNDGGVFL